MHLTLVGHVEQPSLVGNYQNIRDKQHGHQDSDGETGCKIRYKVFHKVAEILWLWLLELQIRY